MLLTKNEEDYLKALFTLSIQSGAKHAGTNQLAEFMGLSPASVNGMLKKLKGKELVSYEKYGKLELTSEGKHIATQLIRQHRLWETFLYNHMNFNWAEVHEVAEQLEHIRSPKLIRELEKFLGFPKRDPHGEPIPDENGDYPINPRITLAELAPGDSCKLISVKDGSAAFLKYVSQLGLALSSEIEIIDLQEFDGSLTIVFNGKKENVSRKFARNVYVERYQSQ